MDVSSSKNSQGVSFNFLLSQQNTLLSHGPEGHVLGCEVGEKIILQFDKALLYQGWCRKTVKTLCN